MAGMRLAAPLLALHDGHSAWSVGILLALFSLVPVFLSLPAGRFADRYGMRRPVGISVAMSLAGAGLAVVFPVFPVLCLAALLTGGATGAATIALQRQVGRAADGAIEIRRAFGWFAIGPAGSNFVGPFVAGLLIDHAGISAGDLTGYRAAFAAMASLSLISWLSIRTVAEHHIVPQVADGRRARAWDLLSAPMMRRLLLVNVCVSSCWEVHMFVVPVLGHERAYSASVIGTILGAFAIAAVGVRLAIPVIASRWREHVLITFALITAAIVFGVYPFTGSPLGMGLCSVLLGLALGSVQPLIMTTLHQTTPEGRQGEALGLRQMAVYTTSVLMPMLFGSLSAVLGVSALFWFLSAVVGVAIRPAWHVRVPPAHVRLGPDAS